jgi:hypothetical protein
MRKSIEVFQRNRICAIGRASRLSPMLSGAAFLDRNRFLGPTPRPMSLGLLIWRLALEVEEMERDEKSGVRNRGGVPAARANMEDEEAGGLPTLFCPQFSSGASQVVGAEAVPACGSGRHRTRRRLLLGTPTSLPACGWRVRTSPTRMSAFPVLRTDNFGMYRFSSGGVPFGFRYSVDAPCVPGSRKFRAWAQLTFLPVPSKWRRNPKGFNVNSRGC